MGEKIPARNDVQRTRERWRRLPTRCGGDCGVVNFSLKIDALRTGRFAHFARPCEERSMRPEVKVVMWSQGVKKTHLNVIDMTAHGVARVIYCKTGNCTNEKTSQGICYPNYPLLAGSKRSQKTCGMRYKSAE